MQFQKYIRTLSWRVSKVSITFLSRFWIGSVEFLGGFKDLFRSFLGRFLLELCQFWPKKVRHEAQRFFNDVFRTSWGRFMVIHILATQYILVLSFQNISGGNQSCWKYFSSKFSCKYYFPHVVRFYWVYVFSQYL